MWTSSVLDLNFFTPLATHMRLFEEIKHKPGINLTPLIDILFILIIFFVVTSRIVEEGGLGLDLPTSGQSAPLQAVVPTLSIDLNETIRLQGREVSWQALQQELDQLKQGVQTQSLVLRIDAGVQHGKVVRLMDSAKTAGFRKILFATKTPASSQQSDSP